MDVSSGNSQVRSGTDAVPYASSKQTITFNKSSLICPGTEQSHSIRMNKNDESTSNNALSVDLLDAPSHPKLKKITRKKEIRFIRAMCELDDANHCIVEEVTCQLCKVITDGTINHSRSKMHVNNLMKCHDEILKRSKDISNEGDSDESSYSEEEVPKKAKVQWNSKEDKVTYFEA